jgi:hypothetical protein
MDHTQRETHDITHLTLTQKSKCGGGSSIHTKGHLVLKNEKMSALPCPKREKKIKNEKMIKKEKKERDGAFSSPRPLLSLRPIVHTH